MDSPPTFRYFRNLPLELQNKIWTAATSERIVSVKWSSQSKQWVSPEQAPAILQVSKQTRAEGLKAYKPSFGTTSRSSSVVYFDFERDTALIYWDTNPASAVESFPDSAKVQYLMIEASVLSAQLEDNMDALRGFTNLREFKISNCRSILCHAEHELGEFPVQFVGGGAGGLVPMLTCVGHPRCRRHWWFSDWNVRVARKRVESWVDLFMSTRLMAMMEIQNMRRLAHPSPPARR